MWGTMLGDSELDMAEAAAGLGSLTRRTYCTLTSRTIDIEPGTASQALKEAQQGTCRVKTFLWATGLEGPRVASHADELASASTPNPG